MTASGPPAIQGLDPDGDDSYSQKELKSRAEENIQSLQEFDYFTSVSTGDYQAGFAVRLQDVAERRPFFWR